MNTCVGVGFCASLCLRPCEGRLVLHAFLCACSAGTNQNHAAVYLRVFACLRMRCLRWQVCTTVAGWLYLAACRAQFVTDAYKEKMARDRERRDAELTAERAEAADDVTRKRDIGGFYRSLGVGAHAGAVADVVPPPPPVKASAPAESARGTAGGAGAARDAGAAAAAADSGLGSDASGGDAPTPKRARSDASAATISAAAPPTAPAAEAPTAAGDGGGSSGGARVTTPPPPPPPRTSADAIAAAAERARLRALAKAAAGGGPVAAPH